MLGDVMGDVLVDVLVLAAALMIGAIPFSQVFARVLTDTDLREHGSGTVSGTGLYEVAGFPALAAAGILEVAKGAAGPALALFVLDDAALAALAIGAAVIGHNWSPFLGGAGGRGISPAIGGLLVVAWPGAVVLLAGLGIGKLLDNTGLVSFFAQASLVVVLSLTHGEVGTVAALAVLVPMWAKRLVGNRPTHVRNGRVYVHRLLYDQEPST